MLKNTKNKKSKPPHQRFWCRGKYLVILIIGLLFVANLSPLLCIGVGVNAQEAEEVQKIGETQEVEKEKKPEKENLVDKLYEYIETKKSQIKSLKEQTEIYEKNIEIKKTEALTLKNQIDILNSRLAKTELDIKTLKVQIEEVNLEIQNINLQIQEKSWLIQKQKKSLAEFMRLIHRREEKTPLELLILNKTFSEFFDELQYLKRVQEDLCRLLLRLKNLKQELEVKHITLENKKQELESFKQDLEDEKVKLQEERANKEFLTKETRLSELKFQNLLYELRKEQEQTNIEIVNIEKQIRAKLKWQQKMGQMGDVFFEWPVPYQGITAYFHDPDYIFRHIFEHPAIDLRTLRNGVPTMGMSVRAAESGYVAKAKDAGLGYSYVMIIHNNGFSTVYGHLSRIDVEEDTYVTKGQVIGLSGGTPGTPGAGRLTTGPHLHFEIRLNGIPVNPLEYLPPL